MKKIMFTDTFIKKLKPPSGVNEIQKSEGNGFTIRVLASGIKTWRYIYTLEGRSRKMHLGQYPDVDLATARLKCAEARKLVLQGIDPQAVEEQAAEERIKTPTVAKLIDEYITKHAKVNKRSWEYDEWLLHRLLLNETKAKGSEVWVKGKLPIDWSRRKARDITKRDVILLLEGLIENGTPAMSNQALKIIRKMFRFAVKRDILQTTPLDGIEALAPHGVKNRALKEAEIKTFWEKLPLCAISADLQRALKLILVTAQRPGEVIGLHTSEIDGDWWTLPVARQKIPKSTENTRLPHRIFLSRMAQEIIKEQIEAVKLSRELPADQEYVGFIFPTPHLKKVQPIDGHALTVAVRRNLNWPLTDAKGQALFTKDGTQAVENKFEIDKFTPHDLRRTATTLMAAAKIIKEHRERVLNHTLEKLDGTYNLHDYDDEKQIALETLERKLKQILEGSMGKVVPIIRAA